MITLNLSDCELQLTPYHHHQLIITTSSGRVDRRVQFDCCTSHTVRARVYMENFAKHFLCVSFNESPAPPRRTSEPHKLTHTQTQSIKPISAIIIISRLYSFLIKSARQSLLKLSRGRTYTTATLCRTLYRLCKTNNIFLLSPNFSWNSIELNQTITFITKTYHGPGDSSAGRGWGHSPTTCSSNGPSKWSSRCAASSRDDALSAGQSQAKYQPSGVH